MFREVDSRGVGCAGAVDGGYNWRRDEFLLETGRHDSSLRRRSFSEAQNKNTEPFRARTKIFAERKSKYSPKPDIKAATYQKKRRRRQGQYSEDDDMPGVQRGLTSARVANN